MSYTFNLVTTILPQIFTILPEIFTGNFTFIRQI